MWEESVTVRVQAIGSWTVTGKPQGSLLTQHLCLYWGSQGASSRGSSWTVRWMQMLRQEPGGHRRRKRWVSCSEASALHTGSCRNDLWRLKCRGKGIYFEWSSSKNILTPIMLKEMSYWGQQSKKPISVGPSCLRKSNSNSAFPPLLGGQWGMLTYLGLFNELVYNSSKLLKFSESIYLLGENGYTAIKHIPPSREQNFPEN